MSRPVKHDDQASMFVFYLESLTLSEYPVAPVDCAVHWYVGDEAHDCSIDLRLAKSVVALKYCVFVVLSKNARQEDSKVCLTLTSLSGQHFGVHFGALTNLADDENFTTHDVELLTQDGPFATCTLRGAKQARWTDGLVDDGAALVEFVDPTSDSQARYIWNFMAPKEENDQCRGNMLLGANVSSTSTLASHEVTKHLQAEDRSESPQERTVKHSPRGQHESPRDVRSAPHDMRRSPVDASGSPHDMHNSPRDIHNSTRDIRSSPRDIHNSPRDIRSSPRDMHNSPRDISSSPRDIRNSPRDIRSSPRDMHNSLRDIRSSPRDIQSSPCDIRSSPRDMRSSPRDMHSSPRDIHSTPRDMHCSPRDLHSSPRDIHSSPCDIHSTPRDMYTPRDIRSSPTDMLKSSHDMRTSPYPAQSSPAVSSTMLIQNDHRQSPQNSSHNELFCTRTREDQHLPDKRRSKSGKIQTTRSAPSNPNPRNSAPLHINSYIAALQSGKVLKAVTSKNERREVHVAVSLDRTYLSVGVPPKDRRIRFSSINPKVTRDREPELQAGAKSTQRCCTLCINGVEYLTFEFKDTLHADAFVAAIEQLVREVPGEDKSHDDPMVVHDPKPESGFRPVPSTRQISLRPKNEKNEKRNSRDRKRSAAQLALVQEEVEREERIRDLEMRQYEIQRREEELDRREQEFNQAKMKDRCAPKIEDPRAPDVSDEECLRQPGERAVPALVIDSPFDQKSDEKSGLWVYQDKVAARGSMSARMLALRGLAISGDGRMRNDEETHQIVSNTQRKVNTGSKPRSRKILADADYSETDSDAQVRRWATEIRRDLEQDLALQNQDCVHARLRSPDDFRNVSAPRQDGIDRRAQNARASPRLRESKMHNKLDIGSKTNTLEYSGDGQTANIPTPPGTKLFFYRVLTEALGIRVGPDYNSARTGGVLKRGTVLFVDDVVKIEGDKRLYLHIADGRGWIFDDNAVDPDDPSVERIMGTGAAIPPLQPREPRTAVPSIYSNVQNVQTASEDRIFPQAIRPVSQQCAPIALSTIAHPFDVSISARRESRPTSIHNDFRPIRSSSQPPVSRFSREDAPLYNPGQGLHATPGLQPVHRPTALAGDHIGRQATVSSRHASLSTSTGRAPAHAYPATGGQPDHCYASHSLGYDRAAAVSSDYRHNPRSHTPDIISVPAYHVHSAERSLDQRPMAYNSREAGIHPAVSSNHGRDPRTLTPDHTSLSASHPTRANNADQRPASLFAPWQNSHARASPIAPDAPWNSSHEPWISSTHDPRAPIARSWDRQPELLHPQLRSYSHGDGSTVANQPIDRIPHPQLSEPAAARSSPPVAQQYGMSESPIVVGHMLMPSDDSPFDALGQGRHKSIGRIRELP